MKKLLIATTNKGKLQELKNFLSDLPVELVSLSDVGITQDVEETRKTYTENSVKKALFYAKLSGLPALADDGGIEIAALSGEPGIHSRRWLGHRSTDEELVEHMKKIAKELPDKNRKAVFRAVITLALPNGKTWSVEGLVNGIISKKPHEKYLHGYPYRSFFYLPKLKKFYHEDELTPLEQKIYNHRWKAINKLKSIIAKELGV